MADSSDSEKTSGKLSEILQAKIEAAAPEAIDGAVKVVTFGATVLVTVVATELIGWLNRRKKEDASAAEPEAPTGSTPGQQ